MTYEMTIVLIVFVLAIVLFVSDRLRADIIGLILIAVLGATKVLTPQELFLGFGNQAVITIGAMFVLSAALTRTGVIQALGARLSHMGRQNVWLSRFIVMCVVGLLSAFVNNTPVIVVMTPAVLALCRSLGTSPSKMLIPMSFISMLAGSATLIGTSTNLLAASQAESILGSGTHFSMFDFIYVGGPITLAGLLYLLLFSERFLPERVTVTGLISPEQVKSYMTEVEIRPGSPLIGKRLEDTGLSPKTTHKVVEMIRGEQIIAMDAATVLEESDILLIRGDLNAILALDGQQGVQVIPALSGESGAVKKTEMTLAEIMIPPDSQLIGRTCRNIRLRSRYGVTAFAIQRNSRHIRNKIADIELNYGDILLVRGPVKAVEELREREAFIVLEGVQDKVMVRRQAPLAVAVVFGVVVLATTEILPISVAAIVGVAILILTRVLTPRQAYYSVDWSILVLIAGTLSLGLAMEKSRAAEVVAHQAMDLFGNLNPWIILFAVYLTAMLLTSFISNNATAVLLIPLSISLALDIGVQPEPFIMAVAYGSSTAFATPIGYQTNLLVLGPGGYYFKDFVKFGVPLNIIIWIIACLLIPIFWPF